MRNSPGDYDHGGNISEFSFIDSFLNSNITSSAAESCFFMVQINELKYLNFYNNTVVEENSCIFSHSTNLIMFNCNFFENTAIVSARYFTRDGNQEDPTIDFCYFHRNSGFKDITNATSIDNPNEIIVNSHCSTKNKKNVITIVTISVIAFLIILIIIISLLLFNNQKILNKWRRKHELERSIVDDFG